MSSNDIVIYNEMRVIGFRSGIKLVKQVISPYENAPTVASLMQLPFSVYFLDSVGRTVLINQEGASVCGFMSSSESVGKSLLHVSRQDSANTLLDNCRTVMLTNQAKIFEEENLRQDGESMRFLSIKIPWYGEKDRTVGVMGVSIVLGKHSLADAIAQLTAIGLLSQSKFNREMPLQLKEFKIKDIHLTQREMQCLQLTIKGFTAKKIAKELGLSFRTIEEYMTNIRVKAGVNSKSELIEMVIQAFQAGSAGCD